MRKPSKILLRHARPQVDVPRRRVVAAAMASTVIAAVAVVGPLGTSVVAAAPGSFTVDDSADAIDAAIDGTCATAGGTCTLRAAVQEANAAPGTTEVRFDPALSSVSLDLGGAGGAEAGDLDIAAGTTVRLLGNQISENETTVVKAGGLGDRHFHVAAGARLELDLVQLSDGATAGDGGSVLNEGQVLITNRGISTGTYQAITSSEAGGAGGAVANLDGASLEVRNISTSPSTSRVDLVGNSAATGGALANLNGTVVVEGNAAGNSHDVYLDSNTATTDGGAVHNAAGSVTIGCRAFARYSSAVRGGNVFNGAGTLTFAGGAVDAGSATDGGGVFNDAAGTIGVAAGTCGTSGRIERSVASGSGGGMYNLGSLSVPEGAQLDVSGAGKGGDATSGGGVHQAGGSTDIGGRLSLSSLAVAKHGGGLQVSAGTFATSGAGTVEIVKASAGAAGGGIAVTGGSLDVSTNIDSSVASSGGGVAVLGSGSATLRASSVLNSSAKDGGGVSVTGGSSLAVVNSTIGRNTASSGGGGIDVQTSSLSLRFVTVADNLPQGIRSDTAVSLSAVLMARNNGANCSGASSGGDRNVFDDWSCSPTGGDLDDSGRFGEVGGLLESDPSGEAPYSYQLQAGHPAIDFVDGKGCGDPDRDQVGRSRPLDGDGDGRSSCDAGAIEADQASPVTLRSISGTVYDETTRRPIELACVYLVDVHSEGDGQLVRTDDLGRYRGEVADGTYLLAFFVPNGDGGSGDLKQDCAEQGIDRTYQPEWYRNVPIEFEAEAAAAADDEADPIMPDLADVTLVEVEGSVVSGIDACLGKGPGAGQDVPCTPSAEGLGDEVTADPEGSPPAGAAADAATRAPATLAFTGASGWLVLVSTGLVLAGTAFLLAGRRREQGLDG